MYILNSEVITINYSISLFTENSKELSIFLNKFYQNQMQLSDNLSFEKKFENPIDMIEIMSTLIDNNEKFNIAIWITLDSDIYINITDLNLDKIIRYLFERYPY